MEHGGKTTSTFFNSSTSSRYFSVTIQNLRRDICHARHFLIYFAIRRIATFKVLSSDPALPVEDSRHKGRAGSLDPALLVEDSRHKGRAGSLDPALPVEDSRHKCSPPP